MHGLINFLGTHWAALAVLSCALYALVRSLRFGASIGVALASILNISDNSAAALKDWYSMAYEDAAWRDNVFLGLVDKETGGGQQVMQSIKIGRTAGHGADVTQAIANASPESRRKFITPWGKSYAIENVDNTEIDVSGEDEGAIVELLGDAMEGCMRKVSEDLEFDCFGDGFGTRGVIASHTGAASPFTLTLSQASDTIKWNVGDIGVSSVANNSAALDTGSFLVTAIDTDAGTMTVTTANAWAGAANDAHFIFFAADKIAGSYATAQKVYGLKLWIPVTAPAPGIDSTGVDRSVDPNKLAGVRFDCRGLDPKQAVNALVTQICVNRSARPDAIFFNPVNYAAYEDSLQNQAVYVKTRGTGEAATAYYEGIKHMGPKGPVTVYSAPGCDTDRFYACTMSSWILRAPQNKAIRMAGRAGKDGLIDGYNGDYVQIRMKYAANLSCSFPGANGVGRLA
jgi:hypothetical protein